MLEVSGLSVDYILDRGNVRAVDDVSFTVGRGEFLGIVGESGCGKSTLLFAVAQLLAPPAEVAAGTVMFDGTNLVGLTDGQLSAIRWRDMSVVMQSAMNALNPVKTIGAQFKDAMRAHGKFTGRGHRGPVRRGAQDGRHRPGAPGQLPAPAVRRDAAAVDDRDGHAVHPGPGHHGRAHLGARRGGAALADGADQGTAAGVRLRGHLRHPRHVADQPLLRPADGDVRRPGGRARRHQEDLRPAAAPLHAGPAGGLPVHPRPARPAQGDPGQPARPGPRAVRLPVPAAVPVRDRQLRRDHAGPLPARRNAGTLPAPRGREPERR